MATFDQQTAIKFAEMIRDLYNGALKPTISVPGTDTQAYVTRGDATLRPSDFSIQHSAFSLLVFPGTSSGADVKTDLDARKVYYTAFTTARSRVHAGFFKAYRSILDNAVYALADRDNVIVAGHSLGGAIALLVAYALEDHRPGKVGAVYTFGQPRVGNGPFARAYDALLGERTFRVVNDQDPVPKLPWMLGTYRHCGREVFLGRDGVVVDRSTLSRMVHQVKEAAKPREETKAEFIRISAHYVTSYIERLKSKC